MSWEDDWDSPFTEDTIGNGMHIEEVFKAIHYWSKEKKSFDMEFIDSVEDTYYEMDGLTDAQIAAIENIWYRFNIDSWWRKRNFHKPANYKQEEE